VTSRPRELLRELAGRWLGEQPVPVGGVARDRRLLRRALGSQALGQVLVVGPGLATRQALPGIEVDVAGTEPHMPEVTVCSRASGAGSLPRARWDTVIVAQPGADFGERLRAVVPACRAGGRLVVIDRVGWDDQAPEARALAEVADITEVVHRRGRWLWLAVVRP
jgi:hypothetical protein